MNLEELHGRRLLSRRVMGMAAVLVPFEEDGRIAEEAYCRLLLETRDAGLVPAVNMDTGYVNLLTDSEKRRILTLASETLAGATFVAGAYIEGMDGNVVDLYRREIEHIADYGGTPILFQTARTHGLPSTEVACIYDRATADVSQAYAFELGKMFAPNGEIWPDETFEAILQIPQIVGMKHSSLDRIREARRLATRDRIRPKFRIFTGNDLGIDMIEYGSDYLLGLAAFSPQKFAERDRLWEEGDSSYLGVADALQLLGNVAFRDPVPAYKHSCALFLHLLGKIPSSKTHPASPKRPDWEADMLASCANRLGLLST